MFTAHRGKGRAGASGTHCPTTLTQLLVPLHFVRVEMKTNCSQMAGQKRAVNSLGLCTHMCRLFCQKGTIVSGTGDQRKPLWCRVDTG